MTKEKREKPPADLVMNRVPKKTLKEFKEFATEEFSGSNNIGDYGMALKHIWDFYKSENRDVRLNDLCRRVSLLETNMMTIMSQQQDNEQEEEDTSEKETLLDGTIVK